MLVSVGCRASPRAWLAPGHPDVREQVSLSPNPKTVPDVRRPRRRPDPLRSPAAPVGGLPAANQPSAPRYRRDERY